jgi:hypothetical protein
MQPSNFLAFPGSTFLAMGLNRQGRLQRQGVQLTAVAGMSQVIDTLMIAVKNLGS